MDACESTELYMVLARLDECSWLGVKGLKDVVINWYVVRIDGLNDSV